MNVQLRPSPLDGLAAPNCLCGFGEQCYCPATEKALRTVAHCDVPMNAEQREWCLKEIGRVEGYSRDDYVAASDNDLARGVLDAWTDYCRDKGLL